MDNIGFTLCQYQADLFEKSKDQLQCSSEQFVKGYMNSDLARRLDNRNFVFEATDTVAALKELNIRQTKGRDQYPSFVLSWMGYLYRYMCHEYHIASTRAYSIVSAKELASLYESYHSLDIEEAILRIFESKGVNPNNIYYSYELAKRIYLK